MKWLCIDPGISGTGWARFSGKELIEWGNVYPKGKTWEERADYVCIAMDLIIGLDTKRVFCEWPANFFSGNGIAALNSGSILKLAFLIGRLNQLCSLQLVPVQEWKGQLNKETTQKRAERFFKQGGFESHASDAVGIGQYIIESRRI